MTRRFLGGGNTTIQMLREHDWLASPPGQPNALTPSLKTLAGAKPSTPQVELRLGAERA